MWKRMQKPRPVIGDPVLLETTLDESTYGSSSTGFGIKEIPKRPMRPERPSREGSDDTITSMREPPPRFPLDLPPPPPQVASNRDSKFRPTSSIYSQPTPQYDRFPRNSYTNPGGITYDEEEEVSPPSSPEYEAVPKNTSSRLRYEYTSDSEVSPIDEMPDISQLDISGPDARQSQVGIGNVRREKRRNQVASSLPVRQGEYAKNKSAGETRFDKYTGEPTTSGTGGRLGVKPGHFQPPALRSVNKQAPIAPTPGNPTAKSQPSFGDRIRNLAKPSAVSTAERPEWKGSSGRVALVSPVHDKPDVQPLNIPRKSSKRVASPPISPDASSSMQKSTDPTIRAIDSNSGRSSPRTLKSPTAYNPDSNNTSRAYPNPASTNLNRVPVAGGRTQTRGNTLPTEVPSPSDHQNETSTDAIENTFREALKNISNPPDPSVPYEQPPSRFSTTTYDPSTAQTTPRPSHEGFDSDAPPLPTPPKNYENSPPRQQPSPILNRKRPKVVEETPIITRKMVGSSPRDHFNPNSPIFISMREGRRTSTISSTGKLLPLSPAEAQSRDLITSLNAQIDNLSHRRMNIAKSIRQMTELMPTDHVVLTDEVRRKREVEKMKVEGLREEEADIRRQEHDLGLRLHRAYKRREKDAVYEPTAFWVRRATG